MKLTSGSSVLAKSHFEFGGDKQKWKAALEQCYAGCRSTALFKTNI